MKKDTFTIKFDIDPSPWFSKYVNITFDSKKIKSIVNEMITECTGKTYQASYNYNSHVEKVINKHWNKELGSIRPFYKALLVVLEETPLNELNWHDGNLAARRVIRNKIAWSTPGFVEARKYNDMFGA